MIQLKENYTYVKSNMKLTGTLFVEIVKWENHPDYKIYTIEDSIVDGNNVKTMIDSRTKRVEKSEINQFGAYLETLENVDFDSMPEMEREWVKAKYALLPFVQTDLLPDGVHTIYNKLPEDWVLCE